MPLVRGGRPLKRWRYIGVFGDTAMVCAGIARVAGVPQSFWAVWDRSARRLTQHTALLRAEGELSEERAHVPGVMDLRLRVCGDPIEVVSPHGREYIWTRKRVVHASGNVTVAGGTLAIDSSGLIDDSAGYHARRTDWEWSAGVGTAVDGRSVAWNLVAGVHDGQVSSERTVWVDGEAREVGPATFGAELERVACDGAALTFEQEAERRRVDRLVVIRSDYVQPFGVFSGTLPGGLQLARGFGVMERHRARW